MKDANTLFYPVCPQSLAHDPLHVKGSKAQVGSKRTLVIPEVEIQDLDRQDDAQ